MDPLGAPFGVPLGHFWGALGTLWVHFGILRGHFGTNWSPWVPFWRLSGPSWETFGVPGAHSGIFGSCFATSGSILSAFSGVSFLHIFGEGRYGVGGSDLRNFHHRFGLMWRQRSPLQRASHSLAKTGFYVWSLFGVIIPLCFLFVF